MSRVEVSAGAQDATVTVAAGQFAAGLDRGTNISNIEKLVIESVELGASLVVLPENIMYSNRSAPFEPVDIAEPLDGPFATALSEIAKRYSVVLVAGMTESLGGRHTKASNTVLAFDAQGVLLGCYRKVHLYDAFGYRESDQILANHPVPLVFEHQGLRFGVMTCYDLRFPEMARFLIDAGAEVLVVPAAWNAGPNKVTQWIALNEVRAIENTAYVIAAGQTGPACTGRSLIVDPAGQTLADLGIELGVMTAELSASVLAAVRQVNPSLANRKFRVQPISE